MAERKEIVFARPVYASELLDKTEDKEKFDNLPAWQRHFIRRVIDHGDLRRAAREAGVSTEVTKELDQKLIEGRTITEALNHGGITPEAIVAHLQECLEAHTTKLDKHGNPLTGVDLNIKMKALELICRLRGDLGPAGAKPKDKRESAVELFESTDPDA